jgi:hypothetical protein
MTVRFHPSVYSLFFTLAAITSAAGVTIDDFSTGPLNVRLDAATSVLNQIQTGLPEYAVIGGRRSHLTQLNSPVPGEQVTVAIDTVAQTYRIDADGDLENYRLSYGLQALNQGPADQALDADFLGLTAFRIDVGASATSHRTAISIRSGVNEGSIEAAVAFFTLPASASAYSIKVPFSSFIFGDVDFSDVDYFSIGEGPIAPGFDLTLNHIAAVPEPASMALLSAGTVGVASIRKRQLGANKSLQLTRRLNRRFGSSWCLWLYCVQSAFMSRAGN